MPRISLFLLAAALLLPTAGLMAQTNAVTFSRRSAAVGDRSEQVVAVSFRLKTAARQGTQVLEQAETNLERNQRRLVTTAEIGRAGPVAVTVAYPVSEQSVNGGEPEPRPVAGKTYRCRREGEQLVVTTEAGDLPTMPEFQTVARNMATLGRENPLAKFLDGRTVRVGDRVDLPHEVAAELLGFEDKLAEAKRFTLELERVAAVEGEPCAVFRAEIEAGAGATGQMGLVISGPLIVQAAGCRAVEADLTGPIGMTESQIAPGGGTVHHTAVGNLRIAFRNRFQDAR